MRPMRLEDPEEAFNPLLRWAFPAGAGAFHLEGRSRGADRTAFQIPELGWMFDAGSLLPGARPERVFVTHTHGDHVHALALVASRRKMPTLIVPSEAAPLIGGVIDAAWSLTQGQAGLSCAGKRYVLEPVSAGDVLSITRGQESWRVEVLACEHSMTCLGYRFSERRRKLRDAFAGLPGVELARLRGEGVDVMEDRFLPRFAFLGDTTHVVFERHPELLETPLVILECSFFDPEDMASARRTQHMHWDDLEPIVRDNPQVTFVLDHLSRRNDDAAIAAFVERVPENAVVWSAA